MSSLVQSLKKAARDFGVTVLLLAVFTFGPYFYDPAVIAPFIQKYAPALPALAIAQIVASFARIVVDQVRHNPRLKKAE